MIAMSRINILTLLLLLFHTLSGYSQQQSALQDTVQLEEVIVTSTKLPVSLKETIRPVTVITRRQIEQTPSANISHILQEHAGIRVNNSMGAPGENRSLFLQGAGGEYILILIDGVAINDPSGVGGAIDLRILPTQNIERIEILRGNQSVLYGTDALAGVVNIITKKGAEKAFSASLNTEYGSYSTGKMAASVEGSTGSLLSYSAGFSRDFSDGISAATAPAGEDFEDDGFSLHSYFSNITIQPNEKITIRPFVNLSEFQGDYDEDAFIDADNKAVVKMLNPGVEGRYKSDKLQATLVYQYTHTEREFESAWGVDEYEGRFQNAELFINYTPRESLMFLAGTNLQKSAVPERKALELPQLSADFISPYASILYRNRSGLAVEAGIRINVHSDYGRNITYNISPGYQLTENFRLFASAGTGFKAPTLEQLFGQFGANPDLDPETSLNYQAGANYRSSDNSLSIQAHYFRRNIDDLIAYGTQGYVNRDEENTQGIEMTVNWLATARLDLGGHYTWMRGETVLLDEAGNTLSRDKLIRKPDHNAGFRASLQLTERSAVVINGEYHSKRKDLYFNPENNYASEEITLDPFFLIHLYGEYKMLDDRLTLYGTIRNLLNADFTEIYGYNTLGTHVKAGVRFQL